MYDIHSSRNRFECFDFVLFFSGQPDEEIFDRYFVFEQFFLVVVVVFNQMMIPKSLNDYHFQSKNERMVTFKETQRLFDVQCLVADIQNLSIHPS